MKIKVFTCGLCKGHTKEIYKGTRKGLREHLKEEHNIKSEIKFKKMGKDGKDKKKQSWWRENECEYKK